MYQKFQKKVALGVTIDNKLTFDSHIKNTYRKARQKLDALLIITDYFNLS